MIHERIAYTCKKCTRRQFFSSVPKKAPRCDQHGPMVREPNKPYRGKKPKEA